MSRSKNHHYVPEAISKNFCVRDKTTFYTSKESSGFSVNERNISSIFKRRHYNSYVQDDGSKDDSLERFFGIEFDNFIPQWTCNFGHVLSGKRAHLFDDESDRRRFIQFFYNHIRRTPDFIDPIVSSVTKEVFNGNFVEEFEDKHRPLSHEEKQRLHDPLFQELAAGNSRVENIGKQTVHILNTMANMQVVIATPSRENKQFIVASNPVARFEAYLKQPLGEPGVEMWTTLTPRIAVGIVQNDKAQHVVSLPDKEMRKLNRQLTKSSRAIAGRSERLLRSLAMDSWR